MLGLVFATPAYSQHTPSEAQVLAAQTLSNALASESDRTPYDWDEVARRLRDVHWRLAGPDEMNADGFLARAGRLETAWHVEISARGDANTVREIVVRFPHRGEHDEVLASLRAAGVVIVGSDRMGEELAYAVSAPGKRRALLWRSVGCGAGGAAPDGCSISYVLTYLPE